MIEFTGERLIPGQVNADLWAEHLSRYCYAAHFAPGKTILDLGCGAGYGTALLAEQGVSAHGIDIAPDAVEFARQKYSSSKIAFSEASATSLPFPNESFDLITAFEVIEHLEHWDQMLAEARRLLRPGGIFLVSTPNKAYYTESRGKAGANPYHVHEFEYQEFADVLHRHFPAATVLLQNRVDAFAFYEPASFAGPKAAVDATGSSDKPDDAYFFLGVCAVDRLPVLPSFVFVPRASNLLRERERHIAGLQEQLIDYADLQHAHLQLQDHLKEQNDWAQALDHELSEARTRLTDLHAHLEQQNIKAQQALDALQKELEDRTKWALSLNETVNLYRASRWVRLGRKLNLGPQDGQ